MQPAPAIPPFEPPPVPSPMGDSGRRILWIVGLYRAIFRYAGWGALMSILRACFVYGLAYAIIFTVVGSLISGIVFGQYLARFASNYVTMYAGLASVIIALVRAPMWMGSTIWKAKATGTLRPNVVALFSWKVTGAPGARSSRAEEPRRIRRGMSASKRTPPASSEAPRISA